MRSKARRGGGGREREKGEEPENSIRVEVKTKILGRSDKDFISEGEK